MTPRSKIHPSPQDGDVDKKLDGVAPGGGGDAANVADKDKAGEGGGNILAALSFGTKKSMLKSMFSLEPASRFHTAWDSFVLVGVLITAIVEPYSLAFPFEGSFSDDAMATYMTSPAPTKSAFEWSMDTLFIMDMIVSFCTAYDTGYKIEYDHKKIALRYLKGWFVIDFLSTPDWNWFISSILESGGGVIDAKLRRALSMSRLIKMARLFRVNRLVRRLTMDVDTNSLIIEAFKLFTFVALMAHILACFFWHIPDLFEVGELSWRNGRKEEGKESWSNATYHDPYTTSLYWAVTTMTTIGYGDISPSKSSPIELIFVVFTEILGLAGFAILLNQINEAFALLSKGDARHMEWKDNVVGFIKQAGIEHTQRNRLISKVQDFLRFKSKSGFHSFSDDDSRFEVLSYALRDEIRKQIFLPTLMQIKCFNDADEKAKLEELVNQLDTDEVQGYIDEDEFKQLITDPETGKVNMTDEEVKSTMHEMGCDENGMVSVEKFFDWYHLKKYNVPRISFPEPFMMMLASRLHAVAFSGSDMLVNKGDYGSKWFILLTGKVEVRQQSYQCTVSSSVAVTAQPKEQPITSRIISAGDDDSTAEDEGDGDRYPMFGIIAGLSNYEHQLMRDRTRRWEVWSHVGACCDVCYIDRYNLLKLFNSTWDLGQHELHDFVAAYYKVDLDNSEDLQIHTHNYNARAEQVSLNRELMEIADQPMISSVEADGPPTDIQTMSYELEKLKKMVQVSTKLNEVNLKLMEDQLSSLGA